MTPPWPRNRLLLALPSRNLKRLLPELQRIPCEREQVLLDADSSLDAVFFPDSGVVSVVAVYADGSIIEMATVGREGCTAIQAVFGAKKSSVRLFVQIPGSAAQMPRAVFNRAMKSMPAFRGLMFAYVQAFLEQVMVSVACNGAHSLKERLARWLLMMRDRNDNDAMPLTQDLLAEMLGVHRPSIQGGAGTRPERADRAWPQAGYDSRPAGPDRRVVRVLSTGPRARRGSATKNLFLKAGFRRAW